MTILLPLFAAALAQEPVGDVSVQRNLSGDRATLAARLTSTQDLERLFPADCMVDWEHGAAATGPVRITYKIFSFRRRLTARWSTVQPERVFELDHEGSKGFVTRFVLQDGEAPDTTDVTLTTYLNPPGWPFRKYYAETVHPAWTTCYEQALSNLEQTP